MRRGGWRSWAAILVAVALLALPIQATAEGEGSVAEGWSWNKFFDLAGCAVGIAMISNGTGFVLATIACGRAASEWWTT